MIEFASDAEQFRPSLRAEDDPVTWQPTAEYRQLGFQEPNPGIAADGEVLE